MLDTDVKVSYTILTHNETTMLQLLLNQLVQHKTVLDEIIIVDDYSTDEECVKILEWAGNQVGVKVYQQRLGNDFAHQKNFANSKCSNEWIFNIDSDEIIDDNLIKVYKEVLSMNVDSEMFRLPRVNKVSGIMLEDVSRWRWNVSSLPTEIEQKELQQNSSEYILLKSFNLIIHEKDSQVKFLTPIINWPDYQTRIYKNKEEIRWEKSVHESVVGFKTFSNFPAEKKYSILHYKDINKQRQQNLFYDTIPR